ncbi:hypothetical protein J1N10_14255 [Carboxylicivirga sp. A043]|uniref:DUF6250 domain-containing protein n=1 Tax=Carboxylicivirga litoralis TaxID=2816963 RepID=UPI0021CB43B9|nr:DUF6250 domain-containing protein [Carboxylicivirga sp. A043]MCU4157146.1 hypothetical protein [Carboxylicivirga sp. A043]
MKSKYLCLFSYAILLLGLSTCQPTAEKVLYDSSVLSDSSLWAVEQQPGGYVNINEEGIEVLDSTGCTIWFKPQLHGALKIVYQITVIDGGGPYDRVSDMNVFWMASEPLHKGDLFYDNHGRSGQFKQYHAFELYYVGCGGHDNTRTRFRRYNGMVERPLLPEHDLTSQDVLLTPNYTYNVQLIADNGLVKYIRDGVCIFEYEDETPLTQGWFGFRIYKSHQKISALTISQLN